MRKKQIFLMKICMENILGFGRMHENKTFFFYFCFLKREINLKVLNFVLEIFRRKPGISILDLYLTM